MSLTKATYSMISGAFYNVLDYGADRTGVTDSRAACQVAIDAAQSTGGTVYFPEGTYLIEPTGSADSVQNGLIVPYTTSTGTEKRVIIQGSSRSSVLKAGGNDMVVIRFSDCYGAVRDLSIDGNGFTGIYGLGCIPESMTQAVDYVHQNFNVFSGLYITGCDEGVVYQCGPDVGGGDSGCWYNSLQDTHIYSCTRGVWLKDAVNVGSSGCNRNNFSNIRIGQNPCNTGVQIDAGDTCKFFSVHFEGISDGILPNAVPTAIYIANTGSTSGLDNNSNAFFGVVCEGGTRDLDNNNPRSQFIDCAFSSAKVNTTGGAGYGMLCIGGNDFSQTPQIALGSVMQSNNQVPSRGNGFTFFDGETTLSYDGPFSHPVSFQEDSGLTSVANGASFDVAITTPRRPQILFTYSNYNLSQSGMYFLCGDGSGAVSVTNIKAGSATVSSSGSHTVSVTNSYGGTTNIYWTLTPFGVGI